MERFQEILKPNTTLQSEIAISYTPSILNSFRMEEVLHLFFLLKQEIYFAADTECLPWRSYNNCSYNSRSLMKDLHVPTLQAQDSGLIK
jgi:hypothetical protein